MKLRPLRYLKLIRVEYPIARVEHMCEDCGRSILPGTRYQKEVFAFGDKTVASGKVHIECPPQK